VPKTYRATVRPPEVGAEALSRLRAGVELEDGRTAPATVTVVGAGVLEVVIAEGRKRQVRRMLEEVGHRVTALERVAFGPLTLGSLPEGESRRLSGEEVAALRAATGWKNPAA
jgi:23S rRNA pseudouridine2605 synthase